MSLWMFFALNLLYILRTHEWSECGYDMKSPVIVWVEVEKFKTCYNWGGGQPVIVWVGDRHQDLVFLLIVS